MSNADINDPVFGEAVEAIDAGNLPVLEKMLKQHPHLLSQPLALPTEDYFNNPYLLWFIAGNPTRNEKLAPNITEVTRVLIQFIKKHSPHSFQQQIDYTLGLVVTGHIARESGIQIQLMDLLIDAGASPGNAHGALAHGNIAAARHLVERGGTLTLTTAVCLDMKTEIAELMKKADSAERETALVAASFFGNISMIGMLLETGVNVNARLEPGSGFHAHATALHQAVHSGSLEAVKILTAAGANLDAKDSVYGDTPLGWSQYFQQEENDPAKRKAYKDIELFLRSNEH